MAMIVKRRSNMGHDWGCENPERTRIELAAQLCAHQRPAASDCPNTIEIRDGTGPKSMSRKSPDSGPFSSETSEK
jgi:hypothetical protein